MKRLLLSVVLASAACTSDKVVEPATQILLRVDAEESLSTTLARVELSVAVADGEAWQKKAVSSLAFDPEDPAVFHIVPTDLASLTQERELVLRGLDAQGDVAAESRRIVLFDRGKERLLELRLSRCDGDYEPTCADPNCHGAACLSCEEGECTELSVLDSEVLPIVPDTPLSMREAGVTGSDSDAGSAATDTGSASPDADATALEDGGDDAGDVVDGDSAIGAEPCVDNSRECVLNAARECESGVWSEAVACADTACVAGRCVGVCSPRTRRCSGLYAAAPEVCGDNGQWHIDTQEAPTGVCPSTCAIGRCTDVCSSEGDTRCSAAVDRQVLTCRNGHYNAGDVCRQHCGTSGCETSPSCGSGLLCGQAESCCLMHMVPGGEFKRNFDGTADFSSGEYTARLSPFLLDVFEVTVGRFRRWVDQYGEPGTLPTAGSGRSLDPTDLGWQSSWPLPATRSELIALSQSYATGSTFTDIAGLNEDLPMNSVDWYVAYAFCIWDGARLPTEAEWNFAASCGKEQRIYPWLTPGQSILNVSSYAVLADSPIAKVGSRPIGDGCWGHSDLGGNLMEWVRDTWTATYPSTSCDDCSVTTLAGDRVTKGGASGYPDEFARGAYRDVYTPTTIPDKGGFRCVRTP